MIANIESAGRTDLGRKRDNNQDQFLIAELCKSMMVKGSSLDLEPRTRLYGSPMGEVFIVADGMGGHQAGNRASALAIDFVVNHLLNRSRWYADLLRGDDSTFRDELADILRLAHLQIEKDSLLNAAHKGMGTTFTMAYVLWPAMYIAHVGDSRCYVMRDGQLAQLTQDHTMANQLAAQGNMAADKMDESPWSNVLWNALGGGAKDVSAEITKTELKPNDLFLLCSDGLNKHVKHEEIQNILDVEDEPSAACRALVELANYRGGHDNITTIVARCGEPQKGPPRTRVAAQITLERMISDLSEYTLTGETLDSGEYEPVSTDSDSSPKVNPNADTAPFQIPSKTSDSPAETETKFFNQDTPPDDR
jgi:protein phosphatase